jgi:hypothetical protein
MTPTLPTKAAEGRPEGIPQDVWDAANAVADLIPSRGPASLVCVTDIARAIMAERERCARQVETGAGWIKKYHTGGVFIEIIAAAIRAGA